MNEPPRAKVLLCAVMAGVSARMVKVLTELGPAALDVVHNKRQLPEVKEAR